MFILMSVIGLVFVLVFLGVVSYFVNANSKITPTFKWILNTALIVIAVLLLLVAFGVWSEIKEMKVPTIR